MPPLSASPRQATLYRMVIGHHICPHGLKARALLRRKGFAIEEHLLTSREEVDAFKAREGVTTTPQVFIGGQRVGGHDDLRRHLGLPVADPNARSYRPVLAVFAVTALMALAMAQARLGTVLAPAAFWWFLAISTCVLAILKLQDVGRFATMFLGYDLLARRWVGYAFIYPFAEALVGVLGLAGAGRWLAGPIALFVGGLGALSVIKAVYIDRRDLVCACVGGSGRVPLGALSLTENLMMVLMGAVMLLGWM